MNLLMHQIHSIYLFQDMLFLLISCLLYFLILHILYFLLLPAYTIFLERNLDQRLRMEFHHMQPSYPMFFLRKSFPCFLFPLYSFLFFSKNFFFFFFFFFFFLIFIVIING